MANPSETGQLSRKADNAFPSRAEAYLLLEPSALKVPGKTINLVNRALAETFPAAYRRRAAPLKAQDIHVLKDESLVSFQYKLAEAETHSVGKRLRAPLATSTLSVKESQAMVETDSSVPNHPIYFPESELEVLADTRLSINTRRIVADVVMAKTFLHEQLHRKHAAKERLVTKDDPLFHLAFAGLRISAHTQQEPGKRDAILAMINQLMHYSSSHNPSVKTYGARVALLCDDTDGERRAIVDSGYDLEEAIVESLTMRAMRPILKYAQKEHPADLLQRTIHLINTYYSSDRSYRYRNITQEAISHLRTLGLHDPQSVLLALFDSQIPHLHVQRAKEKEYFV